MNNQQKRTNKSKIVPDGYTAEEFENEIWGLIFDDTLNSFELVYTIAISTGVSAYATYKAYEFLTLFSIFGDDTPIWLLACFAGIFLCLQLMQTWSIQITKNLTKYCHYRKLLKALKPLVRQEKRQARRRN